MANPSLSACLAEIKGNSGKHYVYVLSRPSGSPFYVGISKSKPKGNQRVSRHFFDARAGCKLYRHNIIRKIWSDGGNTVVSIDSWHESRQDAARREVELIASLGRHDTETGPLANKTSGGEGVSELAAETRAKLSALMSEWNKKRFSDPEYRAAHAERVRRHHADPDVRKKISKEQREIGIRNGAIFKKRMESWAANNPIASAARKENAMAANRSAEGRAAASLRSKKQFSDPDQRAAQSQRVKKRFSCPLQRAEQAARIAIAFAQPEYRKKRSALSKTQMAAPEMRRRLADAANVQWSDPAARLAAAERAALSAKTRREIRERCKEILALTGSQADLPRLGSKICVWRDTEAALIKSLASVR